MFGILALVAAIPVFLTPLSAQQGPNATASAPAATDGASSAPVDYAISPDDLLDISVFDVPEMSHSYRVRPGGSITLALLPDPIQAAGLTPDQLAAAIRDRLKSADLVSDPRVTVDVRESRMHSIAVTGAVKKPQLYPVFGKTTLLDVLAQAEGLADDAGGVALVTRGGAEKPASGSTAEGQDGAGGKPGDPTVIDLKRLMQTGDRRLNVDLYPGDRVTVERAGVVYVVGAVNRPGGFVLTSEHEPMTVLKALALAEDLKPTAIPNKAVIIFPDAKASGAQKESPVKLKDILAGRAPDRPLQADEILFVPDSTGQRAMRRAAEAAVQITTGVIIWRL
jgi:polysaccharide biosynthesis/export protein